MQRQIALDILGHQPSGFVVSSQSKLHREPLCNYSDVHCTADAKTRQQLLAGLSAAKYPCLVRQWLAEPQEAFTVPRSANGTIDLKGGCSALPPLAPGKRRSLCHLYQ